MTPGAEEDGCGGRWAASTNLALRAAAAKGNREVELGELGRALHSAAWLACLRELPDTLLSNAPVQKVALANSECAKALVKLEYATAEELEERPGHGGKVTWTNIRGTRGAPRPRRKGHIDKYQRISRSAPATEER